MVTHVLQQSTRGVPASWALSRRLFDLAPVGVCRAAHVAVSAVGSYPAFSPLPALLRRRSVFCGTVRRAKCTPRSYLATLPSGARTFLEGIPAPVATVRSVAHTEYSGFSPGELPGRRHSCLRNLQYATGTAPSPGDAGEEVRLNEAFNELGPFSITGLPGWSSSAGSRPPRPIAPWHRGTTYCRSIRRHSHGA